MLPKSSSTPSGSDGAEHAASAIPLLKSEHAEMRRLLAELVATTPRAAVRRAQLRAEVGAAIRSHSKIEEAVFYPAGAKAAKDAADRTMFTEALEEHHVADVVLSELDEADATTDDFSGKAKVLKDLIEHHAGEEEREMFPRMQKLLSADERQRLGDEMHALKGTATAKPAAAAKPTATAKPAAPSHRGGPGAAPKPPADQPGNTTRIAARREMDETK